MDSPNGMVIFVGMVFVAVFMLSQGLIVPVFGEGNKMRKRLKARLDDLDAEDDIEALASLVRKKHLDGLTPWERQLEQLPAMENLRRTIEQAGWSILSYRFVLVAIVLSVSLGVATWLLTRIPVAAIFAALIGGGIPFIRLYAARQSRMALFEEQLPDAIDSMKRALKAGHPFAATIKLVAEDMEDPIASEFEQTFADINYGNDLRRAMLGLLQRVPSMTVMAVITSVLVQKETGGNLAEILEQIGQVIRGRFRFQRRVQTLSAEGRMSAWILALLPFGLFALLTVSSPDYLPVLIEHPTGQKMIAFGGFMGIVGIMWIRRIIRIDV